MKTLKLSLSLAFMLMVFLSSAQEKPTSYWVTTDAGEQLEIFPSETPYTPDATKASGSLATLYGSNNGGDLGGAVYFDLTVGSQPISITSFDVNSADPGSMNLSVYTIVGTAFGNETNAGAWGTPTNGAGVGAGLNLPSNITLNTPINLSANTTYGIALVMDASHGHDYTNGTGTNQSYSNGDLSLSLGTASNVPFTAGIFSPRVWNGTVYYTTTPSTPISNWAIVIGLLLIGAFVVVRYRTRLA